MKSLNIKDPDAWRLATAIAERTGETLTRVVTESLRERYQRLPGDRRKASIQELQSIARRTSAQIKGPYLDHAELLYDGHGLPK
ncbi:MAG: type II toxin-antitoxin system VapB family antitoxin [Acidobacteriaceae bacterium]